MPQVLVWKCPYSGRLFEARNKYRKHLLELRKSRSIKRSLNIEMAALDAWFAKFRKEVRTFDELKGAIIANQDKFWALAASKNRHGWADVGTKKISGVTKGVPVLLEFTHFRFGWSDSVSNSHSCPINGVQNFGNWGTSKNSYPTGYPGWTGRITWRCRVQKEWAHDYISSDLFDGSAIFNGSGGGGGGCFEDDGTTITQEFSYDFKIFAHDWRGLYETEMRNRELARLNREKQETWMHMGGNGRVPLYDALPEYWVMPELPPL